MIALLELLLKSLELAAVVVDGSAFRTLDDIDRVEAN
jgi:hypothetical protein